MDLSIEQALDVFNALIKMVFCWIPLRWGIDVAVKGKRFEELDVGVHRS